MAVMRGREGWYDPQILEAFAAMRGISQEKTLVLERMVKDVTVGMTFGEDLKSGKGLLLIARGQEVTPALLERMRNFSAELAIREPVRMLLHNPALVAAKEPATSAKAPVPAVSRAQQSAEKRQHALGISAHSHRRERVPHASVWEGWAFRRNSTNH
jgi:hypothetical protein